MRFLVDAQLPIGLARMLQSYGHESKHVADLEMMEEKLASGEMLIELI
jgi:predicted nuclease of predicted toxin-antitoxin system